VTYHFPSVDELRRATFDLVGSLILDEIDLLAASVSQTQEEIADVAAIFVADLCGKHRPITVAVLQLFALADGDDGFREVAARLNTRMAEVFASFLGSQEEGAVAAAAIQGIILVAVSTSVEATEWAAGAARAIIRPVGVESQSGTRAIDTPK
jgi:DNA-binding transcriptional regulator YbjK